MKKDHSMIVSLKAPHTVPETGVPRTFPPPKRPKRYVPSFTLLGALVLVILGGWFGISWLFSDEPVSEVASETVAEVSSAGNAGALAETDSEIAALVERVGRHIVLPKSETPTVATVSDPEKLSEQVFFANAQVGDKVLIYARARKAYLYDPRADKILEVAPLSVSE